MPRKKSPNKLYNPHQFETVYSNLFATEKEIKQLFKVVFKNLYFHLNTQYIWDTSIQQAGAAIFHFKLFYFVFHIGRDSDEQILDIGSLHHKIVSTCATLTLQDVMFMYLVGFFIFSFHIYTYSKFQFQNYSNY